MDSYSRIKLNIKTAKRFRKFSEQIAGSHSEALTIMMDFFDQNKISPTESLGPNMKSLENNLKGRINAHIAIIKDIEKNKVNPTLAILESLMEAADPKNKKWNQKRRDYEEDDSHPDFYK
jgi:hypothetical protein